MAKKESINALIVEDSPDDAELVTMELQRHGFEPQTSIVETEQAFADELHKGRWDIVICDYSMPTFDALRALEVRRKQSVDIPFILVSGTVGEENAVEAMRYGADDYVMKDNLNRLGAAVERELKNLRHRKEKEWAEQKYRLLFEHSTNGVMLCCENGKILEANDAACRMLGFSGEELDNVNLYDQITSYQTDDGVDFYSWLTNEEIVECEVGIIRSDDSKIPVAVSAGLLKNGLDSPVASFILTDISDRVEAENQLKTSLNEKQVLLSEIHHRVKNNMAIVSGLLYMQSEYVNDPYVQKYFREGVNRIKSMATVHELLYRSESFDQIDFEEYIRKLVENIKDGLHNDLRNINIHIDCSNVKMNLNKAIPCGLIIHELITNAYLHAYGDKDNGEIRVRLEEGQNQYILDVEDDGNGVDEDQIREKSGSMGMLIIKSLVNQLEAEMEISGNEGTHVRLFIPSK